ncbi:uncharacterized protein LOC131637407 [Vicia villosa]|uniref:uncharacterized protein LOC131637407 n=1 Tax=Vicia villosa TaxID=3911 RepID=UPI00273CED9F|nr:uncharacterized protein LOC131637407 [Vicia villosa]
MAIELCSENCGVSSVSPRISFSQDFSQTDAIPVEQHPFRSNSSGLNSSIDFDFCVNQTLNLESSSAEELFSDGRILPAEIKKKKLPLKQPLATTQSSPSHPPLNPSNSSDSNGKSLRRESSKETSKESKYMNDEVCEKQSSSSSSKSFWSFKRSSSCGSGYGRSLCPLPLLSRSNSTGSTSSVKRNSISKDGISIKQNSQKHSSSTRLSNSSGPNSYLKPPLNKSHGSHGSVRVNPVLNVPSANLFGLGSIFSNNRDKSKKK